MAMMLGRGRSIVCSAALVATCWMLNASFTVAEDRPAAFVIGTGGTNDLEGATLKRIDISIALLALDSDDEDDGHEYGLVGMPVLIRLVMANGADEKEAPEWQPSVLIVSNWWDQVSFAVTRPDGFVVSNAPKQFLPFACRFLTNTVSEVSYRLGGFFTISTSLVGCAAGDYVINASWRGVVGGTPQKLSVRAPAGDLEKAKSRLANAMVSHGRGDFNTAITEFDAVLGACGKNCTVMARWGLESKGDALCAANRLHEALAVYKECLDLKRKEYGEDAGSATMGLLYRIGVVETIIASMNGGGP